MYAWYILYIAPIYVFPISRYNKIFLHLLLGLVTQKITLSSQKEVTSYLFCRRKEIIVWPMNILSAQKVVGPQTPSAEDKNDLAKDNYIFDTTSCGLKGG